MNIDNSMVTRTAGPATPAITWDTVLATYHRIAGDLPDPDRIPRRFNCAPDVWNTLRATASPATTNYATGGGFDYITGMQVTLDLDLERGAWQVLSATGSILRDSRDPRP